MNRSTVLAVSNSDLNAINKEISKAKENLTEVNVSVLGNHDNIELSVLEEVTTDDELLTFDACISIILYLQVLLL